MGATAAVAAGAGAGAAGASASAAGAAGAGAAGAGAGASAAGVSAVTSLFISVGIGTGAVIVAGLLIFIIAYLDLVDASTPKATSTKQTLVATAVPLGITFATIVFFKGTQAVGLAL